MKLQNTAWIFAMLARLSVYRKIYDGRQIVRLYLKYRRRRNEKPYKIRGILRRSGHVHVIRQGGMEVLRLRRPDRRNDRHILYLHGSGYVMQPTFFHRKFFLELGRRYEAEVRMPLYPKAPNAHFAETSEKLIRLYAELLAETEPANIVIAGDSSGGASALALAQSLLGKGMPQPGRLLLISPVLDSSMINPDIPPLEPKDPLQVVSAIREFGKAWAGGQDLTHPGVSPLYGPVQGLADMVLVAGTSEILLPDIRRLQKRIEVEGGQVQLFEYDGMMHDFPLLPIPEADRVLKQIGDVLYVKPVK
ncbi:alpha/beta hydrolase fold domain-containing protein [Saccharibacillus deserti]|uniref:alpha/beta hydrolase fold domain-containing protein n=1 Tax=Saccharibacillus deserti TaxID=1634444 RepID=UPI0015526C6C|nr:alpha/beta hydrolase [Saccharibacillus deserti]